MTSPRRSPTPGRKFSTRMSTLGGEPPGELAARLAAQVDRDAALAAVDRGEVGADPAAERRAPGAGVVAGAGPLDLDDLGPEVGEQHRRVGAREDAREVEHPHPGEGREIGARAPSAHNIGTSFRNNRRGAGAPTRPRFSEGPGELRRTPWAESTPASVENSAQGVRRDGLGAGATRIRHRVRATRDLGTASLPPWAESTPISVENSAQGVRRRGAGWVGFGPGLLWRSSPRASTGLWRVGSCWSGGLDVGGWTVRLRGRSSTRCITGSTRSDICP